MPDSGEHKPSWKWGGLLGVVIVVGLAGILRFRALDFGDPCAGCRPDEEIVLMECVRLVQGAPHVHFFKYPPGMMILESVWIMGLQGAGILPHIDVFIDDPMPFHVAVRTLSALLGMATVLLVFLIARRLAGDLAGWVAGLCLAVMPLHVVNSHFGTVDVPGTFFMILCIWLVTGKAGTRPGDGRILVAAAAAGFAAGIKYPFGVALLLPLLHVLRGPRQLVRLFALATFAVAGFLLAAPTFLFQLPDALSGIMSEAGAQQFHRLRWDGESPLLYHLGRSIWGGAGSTIVLLALAGIVISMRRCKRALALLMPVVVILLVHGTAGNVFTRYMVPVMPVIAVFAGLGAVFLLPTGRDRRSLGITSAVLVAVLILPTWHTWKTLELMGGRDSRGELIESFRNGRVRRDLPVLIPFYPFLEFPGGWRSQILEVFAQTYQSDICERRVEIDRLAAQRVLGDRNMAVGRVDSRVYGADSWGRVQKTFAGKEVVMVFPRAFSGHYTWYNTVKEEILAGTDQGKWSSELLLRIDPTGGRGFPPRDAYDYQDYWFIPFDDPGLVSRPGPIFEIYKVRFPKRGS